MAGFIGCYLLQSKNPQAKGRSYIGFTVNPRRRIRQHNGEITNGAYKTKKWRPWDMVLVVYGFPTQTAALQFEWTWQHPERSLDVRDATAKVGRKARYGVKGKVLMLMEILNASPWKYYPLTIQFLSGEHVRQFQSTSPLPPSHIKIIVGPLEDIECSGSDTNDIIEHTIDIDTHNDSIIAAQTISTSMMIPDNEICQSQSFDISMDIEMNTTADTISSSLLIDDDDDSTTNTTSTTTNTTNKEKKKKEPAQSKRKQSSCFLCTKAANRTWIQCQSCTVRTHIDCLARFYLNNPINTIHSNKNTTTMGLTKAMDTNTGPSLCSHELPTLGQCPSCAMQRTWIQILTEDIKSVGWAHKHQTATTTTTTTTTINGDMSDGERTILQQNIPLNTMNEESDSPIKKGAPKKYKEKNTTTTTTNISGSRGKTPVRREKTNNNNNNIHGHCSTSPQIMSTLHAVNSIEMHSKMIVDGVDKWNQSSLFADGKRNSLLLDSAMKKNSFLIPSLTGKERRHEERVDNTDNDNNEDVVDLVESPIVVVVETHDDFNNNTRKKKSSIGIIHGNSSSNNTTTTSNKSSNNSTSSSSGIGNTCCLDNDDVLDIPLAERMARYQKERKKSLGHFGTSPLCAVEEKDIPTKTVPSDIIILT